MFCTLTSNGTSRRLMLYEGSDIPSTDRPIGEEVLTITGISLPADAATVNGQIFDKITLGEKLFYEDPLEIEVSECEFSVKEIQRPPPFVRGFTVREVMDASEEVHRRYQ
jgi:hypothetical protein